MAKVLNEERKRDRVQTMNELPSRTVQSEAVRSDIREILRKYQAVGIVDHLRNVDLMFRDVTEFEDFADLMQQTKTAEQEFLKLPAKIREVFENDVNKWLDAAHDPEKIEALRPQLEELGVLKPVPASPPAPAAPSPEPSPQPSD